MNDLKTKDALLLAELIQDIRWNEAITQTARIITIKTIAATVLHRLKIDYLGRRVEKLAEEHSDHDNLCQFLDTVYLSLVASPLCTENTYLNILYCRAI